MSGGGTNIFRGHDNVQGATDVGPNPDSLPGYYGLADGSFKHFAKVWGVEFDWIKSRYPAGMMGKPGLTVSRWIDGVLEKNEAIDQDNNVKCDGSSGATAPNSQTQWPEDAKKAFDANSTSSSSSTLTLPLPPRMAAMPVEGADGQNPNRAVYLLPAATQFETSGSATASNRSIQWREKVIEPLVRKSMHRSRHHVPGLRADRMGFGDKELVEEPTRCITYKKHGLDWKEPDARSRSCVRSTSRSGPLATPARAQSGSRRTCAT